MTITLKSVISCQTLALVKPSNKPNEQECRKFSKSIWKNAFIVAEDAKTNKPQIDIIVSFYISIHIYLYM